MAVGSAAVRGTARFAPALPLGYYSRKAPVSRFAIRSAAAVMAEAGVLLHVRRHARGTDSALPILLRR
jgi:hypothetical protein